MKKLPSCKFLYRPLKSLKGFHLVVKKGIHLNRFRVSLLVLILSLGIIKLNTKTNTSPTFHQSGLFSSEYKATIPANKMSFLMTKENKTININVKRENSSINMTLPLDQATITNNDNELIYQNKSQDTEIRYKLITDGLKESIIINKKPLSNEFKSNLSLDNLTAKVTSGGLPIFFDNKGTYQFNFEKPFAQDANGKTTYNLKYKFQSQKERKKTKNTVIELLGPVKFPEIQATKYTLVVSVDDQWLNDPLRKYPIIIDPTVVHNTTANFAAGTLNRVTDTGSGASPLLETYYQELPADINTISLWHFNEASGDAVDSSGNGNTGTELTAPTVVTGKFGNARSFNGTSNGMCVTSPNLKITNLYTVEAWVKGPNLGGFSINQYSGANAGWILAVGAQLSHWNNVGGWTSAFGPGNLNDGYWHHIAMVINNTQVYFYQDGVLIGNPTLSPQTAVSANYFCVGRDTFTTPSYNGGTYDEIRISNIARTPEEIKLDAQRRPYGVYTSDVVDFGQNVFSFNSLSWTENGVQTGNGETLKDATSLVAQWNFNATTSTATATNDAGSCGASCNGTLTGFANTTSQDALAGSGWTANNRRWGAGALMFSSAASNYVTCTDANCGGITQLDIGTRNWTIAAWIKTISAVARQAIVSKGTSTGQYSYELETDVGIPRFYLFNTADGTYMNAVGTTAVNDDNWHFVIGTYDGTTIALYIDGLLNASSTTKTGTQVTDSTSNFSIGARTDIAGQYFNGVIDSTSIYSRALTASEILSNYQAGNIELQTRVGGTSAPDATWEAWKPTTSETAIDNMDNPLSWATPSASIWPGAKVATSSATNPKVEGTGSMKTQIGAPQVDSSTVGLWHLEETSGTGAYLKDSTANANHATPTSTTLVDGFYGKARNMNGGSINLPISTSQPITMEAWVKPNATGDVTFFCYTSAADCSATYSNSLRIVTGAWNFYLFDGAQKNVTGPAVTAGQWYHIVSTATNNGSMYLYVNGVRYGPTAVGTIWASGDKYLLQSFNGIVDEVRVSSIVRSADEIAEAYRAGRDHRISKTIVSTDLFGKTKLPFYVASDRHGTFLEATIGESAFINNEPDANTVGFWHLEENLGVGNTSPGAIKDSSGNGNNGTTTGTTFIQGKIGKARSFNGSSDYVEIADAANLKTTSVTVSAWIYADTLGSWRTIVEKEKATDAANMLGWRLSAGYNSVSTKLAFTIGQHNNSSYYVSSDTLTTGTWYHVAGTYNGTTASLYVNGELKNSQAISVSAFSTTDVLRIGRSSGAWTDYFDGTIDEVRVDNIARTPDEIRQTYEIGKRTHPITIDFVTTGLASNLLADANDLTFDVATTSGLYKFDKIIVKENVNGTEYIAEGDVSAINTTTRTITVTAWDTGSTFPAAGFTAAATVFKWQREWMDITGSRCTADTDAACDRYAITRLTTRITDGSQGANFWLDDFRSGGAYLTNPAGESITSSIGNRYFQYRAILSSTDTNVSPQLNSVTMDYTLNNTPATPSIQNYKYFDNAKINSTTPTFNFKSTDTEANDLEYEIQVDDDNLFGSPNIIAESSTSSGFLNTENGGDTHPFTQNQTISYTVQSALTNNTTYWYRLRARDPGGFNLWSSWMTARSFTIDTSLSRDEWFQTTKEQFDTDTKSGVKTNAAGYVELDL